MAMYRQALFDLPIFQGFTPAQLDELSAVMQVCEFACQRTIFEQGQSAEYLYILASGEVHVQFKPYDGPPLLVARIEPGGVFGWSAALGRKVYTSGAVSVCECQALRMSSYQLHHLCEQHPETGMVFLERLADLISERLRSSHGQIMQLLTQGKDLDIH